MAAHKPTYRVWAAMKSRCQNLMHEDFASYGGRGIKVCIRWQRYDLFLADMGEKPEGMSIDRINNNGDYEPGNCRWATSKEQAVNRRNNKKFIGPDGREYTLSDVARLVGITPAAAHYRVKSGTDVFAPRARAFDRPTKYWEKV